ncbi:MAG: DRTGG domain-containing protein [Chloroflexi bacterium]|nr:DRTGG domain-containing protein [Chloroflexota bacterium]
MATLIIASISDRAGKTALAAALAVRMGSENSPVGLGKASGSATADSTGIFSDASTFASLLPENPAVSGSFADIASKVSALAETSRIVIIEGSSDVQANLQLAEATDGLILLVARYGEGISAAAATCGSRLGGIVLNAVPRYRGDDVSGRLAADIESEGAKLLGTIPDDRRLLAPKLSQVTEFLGGQFLTGESQSDQLLDNFLIGGLVLDWGPFYFSSRKNTGVIVRGDRPDVQLAAIQTDTTRALILTKGVRPVEYVMYEAEKAGVPLVIVPGSTPDVAEQLEGLQPLVGFDHPDKLSRMVDLVWEHIDIAAIEDQLAQPATR